MENTYGIDESAGDILLKYMVHLKTQQAYARNEGDQTTANQIQKWFDRFDSALQILLDEESIHIEYDYKNTILKSDKMDENHSVLMNYQTDIHP